MTAEKFKNLSDKKLLSKPKQKQLNIITTRIIQNVKEIKDKNGLKTFDKLKRFIKKHKDAKFNSMFNLLESDIKMKLFN